MKYRVEDKYVVYEDQLAYIRMQLQDFVSLDPNMKGDSYLIRSIYFDDMFNSCMAENESGINSRHKYRIRTYDNDPSLIKLERKGKQNGFTTKESAIIDRELVEKYMACADSATRVTAVDITINKDTPPLLKQLYADSRIRAMSPVNIVEYERTAYVDPRGNVRITIDRNIGGSTRLERFFEDDIYSIPALPAGAHILEVKYDEFIPDHIRAVIDTGGLSRTSFSKYYYTRVNEVLN